MTVFDNGYVKILSSPDCVSFFTGHKFRGRGVSNKFRFWVLAMRSLIDAASDDCVAAECSMHQPIWW